jgi:hypothetical protein
MPTIVQYRHVAVRKSRQPPQKPQYHAGVLLEKSRRHRATESIFDNFGEKVHLVDTAK